MNLVQYLIRDFFFTKAIKIISSFTAKKSISKEKFGSLYKENYTQKYSHGSSTCKENLNMRVKSAINQ